MPIRCPGGRRAALADAVLAVAFFAAVVAITRHIPVDPGQRALDRVAYAIFGVAALALALRRRSPAATLLVIDAVLVAYVVRDHPGGPIYFALCAGLFTFTAAHGRNRGLLAAGAAIVSLVVSAWWAGSEYGIPQMLVVGWALAAVFVGDAARSRSERATALRQRAADQEQARAEETRRLIAEDRLRIARELHDSVAHAMTIINVQAGAAAHVMTKQPERVREALLAIQHASSDVLEQMNALLRVVRVEGDSAERAPTPDLAALDTLVQRVASAGLHVDLRVDGALDDLPRPVSTAAYRIVQESLTNVLRHAGTRRAAVHVDAPSSTRLTVVVTDDGAERSGIPASRRPQTDGQVPGAHLGIIGMRERVAATGGVLRAGPRAEGGFMVHASWSPA